MGPEIEAGSIEAECREVEDRRVKRRCNEGFLILRVRKDDVDVGPGNWGVDIFVKSLGGRTLEGDVGKLPADGNCTSPSAVGLVADLWEDGGKERSEALIIVGGRGSDEISDLYIGSWDRGRWEEEGISDDAKESVEDDKDGGDRGFGGAGLTELERLHVESSFNSSDSEGMAPDDKTSVEGDGGNDCDTRLSVLSLSRYSVDASRLVPSGGRGSGRLP